MKLVLWLLICILITNGCSYFSNKTKLETPSSVPKYYIVLEQGEFIRVIPEFMNQTGLEHWKIALVPKPYSLGRQGYDIEFQNSGHTSIKNVTMVYRVDTKEKLSGENVKADSKTLISKLDPAEKITFSDISLPIDTPIHVEVDWQEGNNINEGTGTFLIKTASTDVPARP
jgi:hypothetical protein